MQIKGNRTWRHTSLFTSTSLNHVQKNGAHAVRLPRRTGKTRNRKSPKKREEGANLRSVMVAATAAAHIGQGRGPEGPMPFFSRPSEAHACLSPAIMSNSSSTSHAQWQGAGRWEARLDPCLEGMGCSNGHSTIRIGADLQRGRHGCPAHAGSPATGHGHFPEALTENTHRASCIKDKGQCTRATKEARRGSMCSSVPGESEKGGGSMFA